MSPAKKPDFKRIEGAASRIKQFGKEAVYA